MKALLVNGSPRGAGGNTAIILDPFAEGLRDAGAQVETILVRNLTINPCLGEFACWYRTPGVCLHDDSMKAILPMVASADILVLATPVYVDGMTGPLKCFLDRIIPLIYPRVEMRDGHCRHPGRDVEPGTAGRIVLVSNCGFWEIDNFYPLIHHIKAVALNMGREFAGALLRPHGPALASMIEMKLPVGDVLDAAREAGRQLAREGRMDSATLSTVSRVLLPLDMYARALNGES